MQNQQKTWMFGNYLIHSMQGGHAATCKEKRRYTTTDRSVMTEVS